MTLTSSHRALIATPIRHDIQITCSIPYLQLDGSVVSYAVGQRLRDRFDAQLVQSWSVRPEVLGVALLLRLSDETDALVQPLLV